MMRESIVALTDWLRSNHMDEALVCCIGKYLRSRGEGSMLSITALHPQYHAFAMEHDTLGWDNFLEGRVSGKLFQIMHESLCAAQSFMRIRTWAKHFLRHLISITHRQWLFRNAKLHLRKLEGKTEQEHRQIIQEVRDMMIIEPEHLLPCHRHLLEQDFARLGAGPSIDRQYWLAQMQSAVSAASHYLPSPPASQSEQRGTIR
jgi:hypothetical protein